MAIILNYFDICDQIPQNIKNSIKLLNVFNDSSLKDSYNPDKKNIIFTTNDDKVYGLGSNRYGCLGFGHSNKVEECTEIEELSNNNIVELFAPIGYCVAKTNDNKLFVWGSNGAGQLGLGYSSISGTFFKPFQIGFFNSEMIEDIKCGDYHTLVLLTNGLLYGWGYNGGNELGFGDEREKYCKPKRLRINGNELRFKYIYCFNESSFAVTTNGKLFSWGDNRSGTLGHEVCGDKCVPKRVGLMNVNKICSNGVNTHFLTNEGLIYFCGNYDENENKQQNTPKKMKESNIIIKDMPQITGFINEYVICIDPKNLFYTLNGKNLEKLNTNCKSFIELYAKHFQITLQTIHISRQNPGQYFIIQSGVKVYPCGDENNSDQKSNELIDNKVAKQDIPSNSMAQIDELKIKLDKLEPKVNADNKFTQKLSQDLENEKIRNNYLSKSLMKANGEMKELKLQMNNICSEGYKDLIDRPE